MTEIDEVLFVCVLNDSQSTCSALNFRTGTNLMIYKDGGTAQRHSLCLLNNNYVLTANLAKPLLHVWPINSQDQITAVRFVVPGRVNTMALCPDNNFLVAGIQESLYIWHLTSGRLLNTISKHYQTISCIRFTDDGSHFVSAGHDGNILVWNLTQVVERNDDNQTPLYSFTEHGLPITDVHIGYGAIRSYFYSVSLDRTCKVYDLSNGSLLLSVVFGEALQSITVNSVETNVYVGTIGGSIYEFSIEAPPRIKEYHVDENFTNSFIGHQLGTPVNCLTLSVDGQTLLSGSQDGQVCVWHIASKQLLKVLYKTGPITNLTLRLTKIEVFNPEQKQPSIFNNNLKRMIDPIDNDDETIEILQTDQLDVFPDQELEEFRFSHSAAISTQSNAVNITTSDDVKELQAKIENLKKVNAKLFQTATGLILRK